MTIGPATQKEITLSGIPASPGIAIGKVFTLSGDVARVEKRDLKAEDIELEVEKFNLAIAKAKEDIEVLRKKAAESYGKESAQIFEAHQLMLEDVLIVDETIRRIRKEKINADLAFLDIMETFETKIANFEDDYLRSRAVDLRDVKRRVISNIQGDLRIYLANLVEPSIIVARELTPSETINLDRTKVLGFATDLGGRTSHAAIMARSLKIPSVVGLKDACGCLSTGDTVVLDGIAGKMVINPTPDTIEHYTRRAQEFEEFGKRLDKLKDVPARTKDSKDIELAANIEFSDEAASVVNMGGDGIGLYRTEYLFLADKNLPSEELQFSEYKKVIEQLHNKPVIIRTFDVGGDKMPRAISIPPEENPFLGLRGIRLYNGQNKKIIKTQIRAILRAAVFGKARILFPMIASVDEMEYCQGLVKEAENELEGEGIEFAQNVPIGAMIEVPSAAVVADLIAEKCDFLSIGTNDLIQYSLAVDRGNENVAHLYSQYNPAILRLIRDIIHKGHQQGVWVGMCGEMASDPTAAMLLIGMGLDEFSVSTVSLLHIKEIIRRVDFDECEQVLGHVMTLRTDRDIEQYLTDLYHKRFKDLII